MIRGIFVLVAFIAIGHPAQAAFPGDPNCPQNDKTGQTTWFDYVSGKLTKNKGAGIFSIVFNRNIGTIVANRQYTVDYRGNGNWAATGYNSSQRQPILDPRDGAPARGGAPIEQHKMIIWGVLLLFNEAGQVFELYDKKFDEVGKLDCTLY